MNLDVKALQSVASVICQDAIVSLTTRTRIIQQLDEHGRDLAATWEKCPMCAGECQTHTTPVNQPDVKLYIECPTCRGIGHVIVAEQTVDVDVLTVTFGRISFSSDAPATQADAEKLVALWTSDLKVGKV